MEITISILTETNLFAISSVVGESFIARFFEFTLATAITSCLMVWFYYTAKELNRWGSR